MTKHVTVEHNTIKHGVPKHLHKDEQEIIWHVPSFSVAVLEDEERLWVTVLLSNSSNKSPMGFKFGDLAIQVIKLNCLLTIFSR